jgi:phosphatidylglycerophosphate synthase
MSTPRAEPASNTEFELKSWSERHAAVMSAALLLAAAQDSTEVASAAASVSFLALMLRFWRRWTPGGRFGAGNCLTLLRLVGVLALPLLADRDSYVSAALALAILSADGLDGWVARRFHTVSPFGQLFDHEVDALLVLTLSLVLSIQFGLPTWIIIPGILRYAYVLAVRLARPRCAAATGNRITRAVAVIAIVALALCLLPKNPYSVWLAAAASLTLTGSFLLSSWHLLAPPSSAAR